MKFSSVDNTLCRTSNFIYLFSLLYFLQYFTAKMILIATTKEYAMMEYAHVNLDGKNKLIVQVYHCEKSNQTFNTITNLY